MRLPPATAECYQQIRKALRGDDKTYLAYNSFLSRNVGFGKEDDHTLKEYVYDKKLASYHPFVTRALVASYFTKARSVLAQSMESHRGIAGDFVFFDASRVASKEVLLVQVWIEGLFLSSPLQVLPDQTSVHAPEAAVKDVVEVILPLAKRARNDGPRPKKRHGEATQSLLFSLVQSLKVTLPIPGLGVWRPSSVTMGSHKHDRKWCTYEAQYYYWHQESHESQWCLPTELRNTSPDSLNVRVLVLVADEGSTGWSML